MQWQPLCASTYASRKKCWAERFREERKRMRERLNSKLSRQRQSAYLLIFMMMIIIIFYFCLFLSLPPLSIDTTGPAMPSRTSTPSSVRGAIEGGHRYDSGDQPHKTGRTTHPQARAVTRTTGRAPNGRYEQQASQPPDLYWARRSRQDPITEVHASRISEIEQP